MGKVAAKFLPTTDISKASLPGCSGQPDVTSPSRDPLFSRASIFESFTPDVIILDIDQLLAKEELEEIDSVQV